MRGPILPHNTRSIQRKHHGQFLQSHIMHYLIIGPLQKGGINRANGSHALSCHSRCKNHRVLLRYTHVKEPFGKALSKSRKPRSIGHGSGDSYDPLIFLCNSHKSAAESLGPRKSSRSNGFSGSHLKRPNPVKASGILLGGLVSLTLLGKNVNENRTMGLLNLPEGGN